MQSHTEPSSRAPPRYIRPELTAACSPSPPVWVFFCSPHTPGVCLRPAPSLFPPSPPRPTLVCDPVRKRLHGRCDGTEPERNRVELERRHQTRRPPPHIHTPPPPSPLWSCRGLFLAPTDVSASLSWRRIDLRGDFSFQLSCKKHFSCLHRVHRYPPPPLAPRYPLPGSPNAAPFRSVGPPDEPNTLWSVVLVGQTSTGGLPLSSAAPDSTHSRRSRCDASSRRKRREKCCHMPRAGASCSPTSIFIRSTLCKSNRKRDGNKKRDSENNPPTCPINDE